MNNLKKYSKPFMVAEKFVANRYVATCPPFIVGQTYSAKQIGEGAFLPNFFGVRDVNNDQLWTEDDVNRGADVNSNGNVPGPNEQITYIGNGWATKKHIKPAQFDINSDVQDPPGYVMFFVRAGSGDSEEYTYGSVHGVYAGDIENIWGKNIS